MFVKQKPWHVATVMEPTCCVSSKAVLFQLTKTKTKYIIVVRSIAKTKTKRNESLFLRKN